MSKERDLLEKWVMRNGFLDYYDIKKETVTFLAQPETEKSSKWWYGKGVEDTKYFLTRKPLSNIDIKEASRNAKDMSFYNGVKWAERQHSIGGGE